MNIIQEELELMAHRYLYYCHGISRITDYEYDMRERAALEQLPESSPLNLPGSDCDSTYSDLVKSVAAELYGAPLL